MPRAPKLLRPALAECAMRKTPVPKQRAKLTNILPSYPLQLVAVDLLGPLLESSQKNSYVLVVSDYFTRWSEAYTLPNQEAGTVVKKLVDEFLFRFSLPEQLHSDQERQGSLKNLLTSYRYGKPEQPCIIHNLMAWWSISTVHCYRCFPLQWQTIHGIGKTSYVHFVMLITPAYMQVLDTPLSS